jgi:hypothetical protein
MKEYEEKKKAEEAKDCTFIPQICKTSKEIVVKSG